MPSSTVELEIPSRPGYVGVVRLALAALARNAGFDEERVDELRIVISEACTNALTAADSGAGTEQIIVRWAAADDGTVVVEVEDPSGPPAVQALEDSAGFSTRQAMSVALLQSLVTAYESAPSPSGTGTITRLTL